MVEGQVLTERHPGSHWYCSQVSRRKAAANSTAYQLQTSTKKKMYRTYGTACVGETRASAAVAASDVTPGWRT